MSDEVLRYDLMVEKALRGMVRDALQEAGQNGLPGNHHFYISFRTGFPGVIMPDYLRARYPDEMTIVLQHQFIGLQADSDAFSVTLSFSGMQERLTIPFSAIVTFADPSVSFALQFQMAAGDDGEDDGETDGDQPPPDGGGKSGPRKTGEVITLDSFRKKK
ncbi:MAG: ClpXP protease specificity-enhancing factor SspB [Pseudomonadota bacterium]|nr:ClpXP protease specificity-enhancing factor SspB [Pseudomonadota bacterium]